MSMRTSIRTHSDYNIALLQTPLAAADLESLMRLLGHKGEPWLGDIQGRYAGAGPDFAVVAIHGARPVSHLWIGADAGYPGFAMLGHVFTLPEHRRQGLARVLLETALEQYDARRTCQVLVLGVDNPTAVSLYERAGFRNLHGPDVHGHQVMIRGPAADGLLAGRWPVAPGEVRRVPFGPGLYASAVLLLNAFPGDSKLRSLGIMTGHEAELQLLEGIWRARRGESLNAFVDEATGCLCAIEYTTPDASCRYGVPCTQPGCF